MKMYRRILIIILTAFAIFLVVNPAYAWETLNVNGSWVNVAYDRFAKDGWNSGTAEFATTIDSFKQFNLKVNITKWVNYREWWQIGVLSVGETSNDFRVKLLIDSNETDVYVVTVWHGYTSYFGLINGLMCQVGADINVNGWSEVKVKQPSFEGYSWSVKQWNPQSVEVYVRQENGKIKVYWLFHIADQQAPYGVVKELNGTIGSAVIHLIYEHSGQGQIIGFVKSDLSNLLPIYVTKGSGEGLLDWLSLTLGNLDFGLITTTLVACITIFVGFVKLSLPLLGFFAIFWVVDCIATSVIEGEPRIIGDMVLRIYDFLRALWQTLVNVVSAIIELITSWWGG